MQLTVATNPSVISDWSCGDYNWQFALNSRTFCCTEHLYTVTICFWWWKVYLSTGPIIIPDPSYIHETAIKRTKKKGEKTKHS